MTSAGRWRAAERSDLSAIVMIASRVHPAFPEHESVFQERLTLYPTGVRVLETEGEIGGYVISHPWRAGSVPALNSLLHAMPDDANTFYMHDLVVLPAMRGFGLARVIVENLASHALSEGFPTMSLVAVNESTRFWQRLGFAVASNQAVAEKLGSYGEAARLMVRRLSAR